MSAVTIAEIALIAIALIGFEGIRLYADRRVRRGQTGWLWVSLGMLLVFGFVALVLAMGMVDRQPLGALVLGAMGIFMIGSRVALIRRMQRAISAAKTPEQRFNATLEPVTDDIVLWTCATIFLAVAMVVVAVAMKITGGL